MWQTRHVVWSKDTIYFARIGESTFFDSIPLAEVRGIDRVDEAPIVGSTAPSSRLKKARTPGVQSFASHASTKSPRSSRASLCKDAVGNPFS